ncbi:MAG: hypothetical protein NUV98_00795 [Candidatus Roizmanbacteria bacterium]|nr:hypothetical protein [Candidatus Roizmanbacteria bacterium]
MDISGRITELKNLGKSFEEIKAQLVSEGYAEPDIINGINTYTQPPQAQNPVPRFHTCRKQKIRKVPVTP